MYVLVFVFGTMKKICTGVILLLRLRESSTSKELLSLVVRLVYFIITQGDKDQVDPLV